MINLSNHLPIKKKFVIISVLLVLSTIILIGVIQNHFLSFQTDQTEIHDKQPTITEYGKIPFYFEPNEGQVNEQVRFLSRGLGYSLFLTQSEAVLKL